MPSDPQRLGGPFSAENVTLFSLLWVTGGKGPAEGPSPGQWPGRGTLGTAGRWKRWAGPLAFQPITMDPTGER